MSGKVIRIAGASGFWGDATRSTPQLLKDENVDFIVYDYLAEITMSIMARARAKNPDAGYALDFVSAAMKPNLKEIARQGVRIVSNAGGVNPQACANALRVVIAELGLNLTVACILGDDMISQRDKVAAHGYKEMFSGDDFPDVEKVASINAYLGAFPVARALKEGADIVVTGRCVDSAVTLGVCIDAFGWGRDDLDQLAMGSLAGHILECGPQATGGNFTDWELSNNLENIGYPIAAIKTDGSFVCSKPEGTGGLISVGTIAEQMVYEIGDPQAYILPDVVCDFSNVTLTEVGENLVEVTGATGLPAPDTYKVCSTYADQFRGGTTMTFYGFDADKKANKLAAAIFTASRRTLKMFGLEDYSETSVELIGAESQYGANAAVANCRELSMKIAVKHADPAGIGILLKECVGLGLATPPGLSGFAGARPKPSPVVRLFSFALSKGNLPIQVELDGTYIDCPDSQGTPLNLDQIVRPQAPIGPDHRDMVSVPLIKLALARSGDKGNKANVGIIARDPEYLPYIFDALTVQVVAERFSHFLPEGAVQKSDCYVERYLMPGSNAINFLIHDVLGGGGMASIRNDAQGKGFGQLMLDASIPVSAAIAAEINH
ncbi:MAG: DUF1446 domain-containing protein [Porticoccaceae bacterium]|nr:DUF1446 domain-containing protein [Porticoccaceae bacterium]MBT4163239.1 DUF1446 domain-containing protein [Porticoccaceae bacterium]MBT5104293.1 DUF1446 domain-containing protein [Porticoccaceae bacterium]MBT6028034.1 DUF1446 domain-containing protein [Porticoccaceae bacterium]MBT7963421.1 DUF1446 domain-containing protein [Porticoccaceae bacterium]